MINGTWLREERDVMLDTDSLDSTKITVSQLEEEKNKKIRILLQVSMTGYLMSKCSSLGNLGVINMHLREIDSERPQNYCDNNTKTFNL
jgi:hypothetical protein